MTGLQRSPPARAHAHRRRYVPDSEDRLVRGRRSIVIDHGEGGEILTVVFCHKTEIQRGPLRYRTAIAIRYLPLRGEGVAARDFASCSEFSVWRGGSLNLVVFDHPLDDATANAAENRQLTGRSGSLPHRFGVRAEELAQLLNMARSRALGQDEGDDSRGDDGRGDDGGGDDGDGLPDGAPLD